MKSSQQLATHLHFLFWLWSKAVSSRSPVCCAAASTLKYTFFLLFKDLFLSQARSLQDPVQSTAFGLGVRTLGIKCWHNLVKMYFHFVAIYMRLKRFCDQIMCTWKQKAFFEMLCKETGTQVPEIV